MLSKNDVTKFVTKNTLAISLGTLLVIFAVMNVFLLTQNLELRGRLRKPEPDKLNVGDRVEPFSAPGLLGGAVDVQYSSTSPRRVFLFFSPSCPYSRMQFPYWNSLIRQAPNNGFQVIALAQDSEDKETVKQVLTTVGCPNESANFQVALIRHQVALDYKLAVTPTTLIISKEGTAEYASTGVWSADDLATASADLGLQITRQ
jgi:hypothetical protein